MSRNAPTIHGPASAIHAAPPSTTIAVPRSLDWRTSPFSTASACAWRSDPRSSRRPRIQPWVGPSNSPLIPSERTGRAKPRTPAPASRMRSKAVSTRSNKGGQANTITAPPRFRRIIEPALQRGGQRIGHRRRADRQQHDAGEDRRRQADREQVERRRRSRQHPHHDLHEDQREPDRQRDREARRRTPCRRTSPARARSRRRASPAPAAAPCSCRR